jgi:hypothetical protein
MNTTNYGANTIIVVTFFAQCVIRVIVKTGKMME